MIKPKNNSFFRAEKSNPDSDDRKVIFIGIGLFLIIIFGQGMFSLLDEKRWFRDIANRTPFYDVVLSQSQLNEEKSSIVVTGFMKKRRCEYQYLTGYLIGPNGERERISVNTDPEDELTGNLKNRPPSKESESWGPWILDSREEASFPFPVAWEIWAHHVCPNQTIVQGNKFLSGAWINYIQEEIK